MQSAHLLELGVEVGVLVPRRDSGMRSNAERDMMTASQSPVAQRATNSRRRSPARSSRCGDQDLGLRVELQPLAGELLEHVVGHDDGGLA